MAFEVEHDWQGNLATPRARIGERVKTRLLIVLCVVWVIMGLMGHGPWKPDEAQTMSIVKQMVLEHEWLAPVAVGRTYIDTPPLFHWSAAGLAALLHPWLPLHDAARLASGLWMGLTLLLMGMVGREMWGVGAGRQTTLVFLSSLGLLVAAHMLMPVVAALTGSVMGFYALVLSERRPYRASVLLGCGVSIAFLSTGVVNALAIGLTACLLPLLFPAWRTQRFALVFGLALLMALPALLIWPLLLHVQAPELFSLWWSDTVRQFVGTAYSYYLRTLMWFGWPALPLAAWGIWRYRAYLLYRPKFQLSLLFFAVSLVLIGRNDETREIYALALLVPLSALAGGSIETLKRGAAGLLNWFGIMLFGSVIVLIWLGWVAMTFGWPSKLSERMHVLSGVALPEFSALGVLFAMIVTATWLLVLNNYKHSNRAAVTDWAVGITASWALLMALWLPWIDHAKSYAGVMGQIQSALPAHFACVMTKNVGSAQQSLLHYYTDIRPIALETASFQTCDVLLIQDERGRNKYMPSKEWKLLWQGKRPAERRERFRLYYHP